RAKELRSSSVETYPKDMSIEAHLSFVEDGGMACPRVRFRFPGEKRREVIFRGMAFKWSEAEDWRKYPWKIAPAFEFHFEGERNPFEGGREFTLIFFGRNLSKDRKGLRLDSEIIS